MNSPKRQITKNHHRQQPPKKTQPFLTTASSKSKTKVKYRLLFFDFFFAGPECGLVPVYPPAHRSHGTMTDVSSPPLYASTTLFNFFLRVGGVVTAVSPSVATAALGAATRERRTCVVHKLYSGSICDVKALFTIYVS